MPRIGETMTRLAPRALICSAMAASAPALTASMTMTEATPMMTPSVVRNERTLLSIKPSQAERKIF
jgi:hypothetical protein